MMKNLMLGDLTLHYLDLGSGYPLILIHGMGSAHTVWDGLLSILSENYRVIALDLRGHGMSSKTPGPYSIELFSHDLYQFLESLNIDQAHFIGHSMGGSIILEMALTHPEKIHSLTLISSFASVDLHLEKTLKDLKNILCHEGYNTFFDTCLQLTYTPDFIQENRELFCRIREDMVRSSSIPALQDTLDACLKVDLIDSLESVKVPVLVIAGREDNFTPPYHGQNIKNAILGAKLEIMDNMGHNLPVEKGIDTGHIIRKFLDVL